MENIISLRGLTFKYKNSKKKAIDSVNLEIGKGKLAVIMGPSSAGKSTLCLTLNGLIPKLIKGEFHGNVFLAGKKISEHQVSELAPVIGHVFQDFESQLFSTNVELEVAFGPENLGLERSEIKRRIDNALSLVGLSDFKHRQPATLSGGEKQRLAIASILSIEPEILCFDEPTTDLDPEGKENIFRICRKLKKDSSRTMLFVEHETEEVLDADLIIIMKDGKILKDGIPEQIFKDVKLLKDIGIMPPQITELFYELGFDELPLTEDHAVGIIKKRNLKFSKKRYQELIEKDKKRSQNYGNVIIKIESLHYSYKDGNEILKDITLSIRKGEFLSIIGSNGGGKTTLAKHFNGLLLPTEGNIYTNGKNTKESNLKEHSQIVGFVFQNPDHQIFAQTVFEEVSFTPKLLGLPEQEIEKRVRESLEAVSMTGFINADPFSLTKGERQRLAVASVLSAKPEVIVLDEPSTGLDYKELSSMMELLKNLNSKGHTIIIITHSLHVVASYCHRTIVINGGEIIFDLTTREVFQKERELLKAHLKLPRLTSLGNRYGYTLLSVDEFKQVLEIR